MSQSHVQAMREYLLGLQQRITSELAAIDALVGPLVDDRALEMTTICRPFGPAEDPASPHLVKVVRDLIDYINSCLDPEVKKQMEMIAGRRDLGFNKKTSRIGILFAGHLVDFYAVMETKAGMKIDARTGEMAP